MSLINPNDIPYIENKYHKKNEYFNPFNRFAYHGYECDATTGLDDEEMAKELEVLFEETKDLPHCLAKAKAFEFVLDNMRIDVNSHDYFVCFYNWGRPLSKTFIEKWKRNGSSKNMPSVETVSDFGKAGFAFSGADYDHVIPNWEDLLSLGFTGLLDRISFYRKNQKEKNLQKDAFYESMEIEYAAVLRLINRLQKLASKYTDQKAVEISNCLNQLSKGAPRNTYEVLQCMYIFFMVCESIDNFQCRSLGNGIDQTLYKFYINDLESGTFTREKIKTYLAYFFKQFDAIGNYWGQPMYIGGTALNGQTKVNNLSFDILDIYEELNLYNPKIQVKLNYNTPIEFTNKILKLIRRGTNSFVFCCEPAFKKAIMSYGATYEEACDFEISGCYETRVKHNQTSAICSWVNTLKAVVLTLDNGFDKTTNKQLGLKTGEVSSFENFEDFYHAFRIQLKNILDTIMKFSNEVFDPVLAEINPSIMYSGTNLSALEKGVDGYAYANKYNHSSIENCGLGSTVDALMVIKEFVFDKKEISLVDFKKVLDANWEGYEVLRARVKNSKCKYGNNNPIADHYAFAVSEFFAECIKGKPNGRGGVYVAELHSARQFLTHGAVTEATPDGRKKGEEISKNASPAMGMDKSGVTALILSALSINQSSHQEGCCLDVMLHPTTVSGEEGLSIMRALLNTYLQGGGMSIHFNIFNVETLRDAQKNPQNYENLQVRVCGWNTLWNNMEKREQEAYILRAENIQE